MPCNGGVSQNGEGGRAQRGVSRGHMVLRFCVKTYMIGRRGLVWDKVCVSHEGVQVGLGTMRGNSSSHILNRRGECLEV